MKNKKTIMAFAAFFILIYHLWINITNLKIEIYLRQLCVIGVDLFFFISAYSITKNYKFDYKNFITNRFKNIYLKFIFFSIIGALYNKWGIVKFLKIITGVELFLKGGGSFLWFLPAIMLVYLILPLYIKLVNKFKKRTFFITIILYLLVVISLSLFSNYNAFFILINRIPIILLGYYFYEYNILDKLSQNKKRNNYVIFINIVFGIFISYYVFMNYFNVFWFKDIFYVLYIPLIVGIILLLDKLDVNIFSNLVSKITLELYALEMLFGFKIANIIFNYFDIKILSNFLTILLLIVLALLFNYVFGLLNKISLKIKK